MPPTAAWRPSERVTTFSPSDSDRHEAGQRAAEELRRDAIALRAGGVDDQARRDVEGPLDRRPGPCGDGLRRDVDDADAADAAAVDERGVGAQVGRDTAPFAAAALAKARVTRSPWSICPSCQATPPVTRPGRTADRGRDTRRGRGSACRRDAARDRRPRCGRGPADRRRGSRRVGEPVARDRAQCRRQERQRPHQVRGDAQQGAPLPHVLAQLVEAQALQAADAAVQRLGVVERGAAADVAAIDQGDAQAAQGRIPGDGRAVDARADDHQIERLAQPVQVPLHAAYPNIGAWPSRPPPCTTPRASSSPARRSRAPAPWRSCCTAAAARPTTSPASPPCSRSMG